MQTYKRNIDKKITSLRLLLLSFVLTGTFLFINKNYNLVYLVETTILFCSLFVVTDLRLNLTSFEIVKYYFFGLIRITWEFKKSDKISIKSNGETFNDPPDIPVADEHTGLGLLYGCLYPVFGKPRIGKINFSISKVNNTGKPSKRVSIFLDLNEHGMVEEIAGLKHSI